MLASILVGIDGSSDCDSALRLALEWAGAVDASLVGLGVVDEPGLHGTEEYLVGELYFRKLHTEILDELRGKVGQALKRPPPRGRGGRAVRGAGGDRRRRTPRSSARPRPATWSCWASTPISGSDGTTRPTRRSPGSWPIVAAGGRRARGDRRGRCGRDRLRRQPPGRSGPGRVRGARPGGGREVHVISADADWKTAARCADRAVEFLRSHEIRARPHPMPSRSPSETILDWVYRLRAGLVVMGAYGKPTLQEFFLGSVTRTLLRESPVPLFLYH